MNDLEIYFRNNKKNLINKWQHYFDIYDRYFSRYRGTDVHILELGVFHGGSMQMWKDYFGPRAKIYGVDINEHCKQLEEDQVEIFIGDQSDREFLKSLLNKIPRIDILLDDGGHFMDQQIITFEELFPHIEENGIYMCEDIHTSYWPQWGGGYKKKNTFIEYSKNLIDKIHAWHSKEPDKLSVDDFTRSAYSLHYYDSILVIEKKPVPEPKNMSTGEPRVPKYKPPRKKKGLFRKIARLLGN